MQITDNNQSASGFLPNCENTQSLVLNPQSLKTPILGIDVGGTKMAAGVVTADGQVLSYLRAPTPTNVGAEGLLNFIVALVRRALSESSSAVAPVKVGVGCGGPMLFPAGVVSPLHIPQWQAFPLRTRLEEALGLATIVDNDAKAFALGEAIFGAGRGARCLLGMVVSTGVGGGIVVDGKLFHGASGNGGHIGHVIVARGGGRCECGAIGCLTVYAAGSALAQRAQRAIKRGTVSQLANLPLAEISGQAIVEAARTGDKFSQKLMHEAATALGRAIASTANILDLDRVIIGGGLAQAGELLFEPLRREVAHRARLDFSRQLEVRPAELGSEAGVIGAAALALQPFIDLPVEH